MREARKPSPSSRPTASAESVSETFRTFWEWKAHYFPGDDERPDELPQLSSCEATTDHDLRL